MKEIAVVLPNIRSIHNVGSVFRTADAAGVSKIYLCGITPRPTDALGKYRNQFSKVALGAEKSVSWESSKSAVRTILRLKREGYKIFSVEQSNRSKPYYKSKIKKNDRVVLVMGNEVKGLPKNILDASDEILEIPMLGGKESLNVSVAFGIAIFGLLYNQ